MGITVGIGAKNPPEASVEKTAITKGVNVWCGLHSGRDPGAQFSSMK